MVVQAEHGFAFEGGRHVSKGVLGLANITRMLRNKVKIAPFPKSIANTVTTKTARMTHTFVQRGVWQNFEQRAGFVEKIASGCRLVLSEAA